MNPFNRYKELFNKDLEQYKEIELTPCIRVNTLKITSRKLVARLRKKGVTLEKIPSLDYGYRILQSEFSLGSTEEFLLGYYYMQEAASQHAVQLLNPKENETVLDMAAAPGGKTTQIAQYMKNTGAIIACDTRTLRLKSLQANINRLGVTNTIIFNKDARFINDFNIQFDKVLLDAPCSGNFAVDKKWCDKRRSEEDFLDNQKTQKQLLKAGVNVLKAGGFLVYASCSLEPEEGEHVIAWAEDKLPIQLVQMNRYFPPEHQGFFVALLRKN